MERTSCACGWGGEVASCATHCLVVVPAGSWWGAERGWRRLGSGWHRRWRWRCCRSRQ